VLEWWSNELPFPATFRHHSITPVLHYSNSVLWDKKLIQLVFVLE
jgi:hypothetical protein